MECVKGEEIVEAVIHGEKIGTIGVFYQSYFLEHLIYLKQITILKKFVNLFNQIWETNSQI